MAKQFLLLLNLYYLINLAIIDFIILLPLLWGAYRGFKKGLIMELVSIIAFILGIVLGFKLMEVGIQYLEPHVSNKMVPYISFILIFILVVIGVNLLGKVLKKVITISLLSIVDKIGGVLFGITLWGIAVSLILWLSVRAGVQIPSNITDGSISFDFFKSAGPYVIDATASVIPFTNNLIQNVSESFN